MSLIEDYKAEETRLKKTLKKAGLYSVLASVSMLAVPMFLFQVYDSILQSRSVETLVAMGVFAIVVLIGYGIFDSVRNGLLAKSAVELEANVSGLLLAGELSRQHGASAQSVRDLAGIRQVIASPAFGALFDLPFMPVYVLLIFLIHPVLGLVVIIGAAILFCMGLWSDRATASLNQEHMQSMIKSHQVLDMHMNSQEIIRAQGMYREVVQHWGQHQGKQLDQLVHSTLTSGGFSSTTKAVRQVIQVLMIGSGAALVLADMATAGVIFATAMIGGRALAPVEQIVGGWRALKQAHATRTRLIQRLEEMSLPENRTKLPRPKGTISLERVVYVPQPGVPPIIKGINGQIQAGDSVAIIGPSGAGKSTLARLIVGYLLPSAGRVTLDGQDLTVWDPVAKGLHIGYMPQQSTFFEATVRENIARLRTGDPEEWAVLAAKRCGVHDLLMKLPQGYDTVISKNGFYPSGGQAQLIALARAFYADPAVLVLDEPNAALDTTGEQVFHKALHTATKRGITTIVVTQRPTVLQHVSKVMLMQDGVIKDFGPKEEVMKSGAVKAVSSARQQTPQKRPGKPAPTSKTQPPQNKEKSAPDTGEKTETQAATKEAGPARKPQKVGLKLDPKNAKKKEEA